MPDAPRQLPPKKEVAIALLEGPSLFVHLDPRRPGVIVPKWFTGQPQLVLQLGLNMAIPIPDLKVEEEAMTCTLSFNRAPFWCRLPWNAVYALVGEDGRGMVWPDDVPPEVEQQMQKQQGQPAGSAKGAAKRGKPRLNAVDGSGRSADDKSTDAKPIKLRERRVARVPDPPPSGEGDAALRDPDVTPVDDRPTGEAAADAAEPQRAPASERPGEKKPKRELPPYLRVIK
jgi:stringent starvation protein B